MRLFVIVLAIGMTLAVLLMFMLVLTNVYDMLDKESDRVAAELAPYARGNLSDVDLTARLHPLIIGLNFVLIIGFLAMLFGVFLKARRVD